MAEARIQKTILDYLKKSGYWTMKIVSVNKGGIPDVYALKDGISYFIEVKDVGKKPAPLQAYRLAEIRKFGAITFWTDNLDKVKEYCK